MTELLPGIGEMEEGSLCHSIYTQLYHNFFNAQDGGTVAEGDLTSIRLHNTAYNFASAIAGGVAGEGGETGGILLDFLKKTGGDMSGMLRAGYGFEAGVNNSRILQVYMREGDSGVEISGNLKIGGKSLYLAGKQVVGYDPATDTVSVSSGKIDLGNARLQTGGEMIIGKDKESGIFLSPEFLQIGGKDAYHAGNANLESVSWKMLDASVSGKLEVSGTTDAKGLLVAEHGVRLGAAGKSILSILSDTAELGGFLSFGAGFGIRMEDLPVLMRLGGNAVQLGAPDGDLLLGSEQTRKVRLQANLWDIDGDVQLVSKYGAACFPASLTVRHNYGDDLLTSYHAGEEDEGIAIHKRLKFGSAGACLFGKENALAFRSKVGRPGNEGGPITWCAYETQMGFGYSTSTYQPQDRDSDSFLLSTSADFFCMDKPVEADGHLGINASPTRLTDRSLFLQAGSCLLAVAGGIRHDGNAYFTDGVGSPSFSSGFAGSGWAILRNGVTGSVQATFDEIIVRKKMRVYEMEVSSHKASNGALWITDSCSGDTVTEL